MDLRVDLLVRLYVRLWCVDLDLFLECDLLALLRFLCPDDFLEEYEDDDDEDDLLNDRLRALEFSDDQLCDTDGRLALVFGLWYMMSAANSKRSFWREGTFDGGREGEESVEM